MWFLNANEKGVIDKLESSHLKNTKKWKKKLSFSKFFFFKSALVDSDTLFKPTEKSHKIALSHGVEPSRFKPQLLFQIHLAPRTQY